MEERLKQENNKLNKKDVIFIIIILVLIIITLTFYLKEIIAPKEQQQNNANVVSTSNNENSNKQTNNTAIMIPKNDEELIVKLSELGERDRMEYYCGVYFKHIEKKEYNEAYSLLYDEFKQKYFPTIEEYEEYIKKTYPEDWALEYDDITRQGNIYVLRLKIIDAFGSKDDVKIQRIVIRENNYNNFVLSFQVI